MAKKEDVSKFFNSPIGHVKDRIIINESPDIPKEGIFISLNGFPFLAQAGKEIDIPRPVRIMLDTRIKTDTVEDNDGLRHTRNIKRFTYQIVKLGVNLDAEGNVIVEKPEEPVTAAMQGL
jgi:hypothetical protein